MGASGAAFTTAIDVEAWDPLAAAPLDDAVLARAARGTGMRADPVAPPFDDDMKALVIDRILEALDAKVPPLARGLVGPSEYGLVVGCDEESATFYARTYFDKTEQPTKLAGPPSTRRPHRLLDRAEAPDRAGCRATPLTAPSPGRGSDAAFRLDRGAARRDPLDR